MCIYVQIYTVYTFYPGGRGLLPDDSALIHKAGALSERFDEDE